MRTTLTIDEDVAVQLERLRRSRDVSLKDLVNEALRRGLRDMSTGPKKRKPFRTRTFKMGGALSILIMWPKLSPTRKASGSSDPGRRKHPCLRDPRRIRSECRCPQLVGPATKWL